MSAPEVPPALAIADYTPSVKSLSSEDEQKLRLQVQDLEDQLIRHGVILAKATHRESHLLEEMQHLRMELNATGRRFRIGPYVLILARIPRLPKSS